MAEVILISQSRLVRFEEYDSLPLERIELFRDRVGLRSVRFGPGFRSHLDLINLARGRRCFHEETPAGRRSLLDIWHLPGLNGVLLASRLLEAGCEAAIINHADAEWDRFESIYASQSRLPLVAISTTFHLNWTEVKRLTARLRAVDPDMEIAVGGAFANEQAINGELSGFEGPMRKYGIRFVLHGFNSESDLVALVRARKENTSLDEVPNLCWLDAQGRFRSTGRLWHDPELGESAALWDRLDLPFLGRTVQIRTASGCPFSCAFCSYPRTAGGHFAAKVDDVRVQLDRVSRLQGIEQVVFVDDTFNVPGSRFEEILEVLRPRGLRWYSFLRCQYLDERQARLMRDSGCGGVYLGVESANDRVLENMDKRARRADYERGMELLGKHGIPVLVALVVGFPGETDESVEEDIRFLERSGADFYSLKEFYYMPHTAIHRDRERYGLTGGGARWTHATMDSVRASVLKEEMFRRVGGPIYVDADTSLWTLAYLRDRGFSLEQVKEAQRLLGQMMLRDLDGHYGENADLFERLKAVVGTGS